MARAILNGKIVYDGEKYPVINYKNTRVVFAPLCQPSMAPGEKKVQYAKDEPFVLKTWFAENMTGER